MDGYSLIYHSNVAKDWHTRGFSCGMWIDHAGREWKAVTQNMDEMFMALYGDLELEIKGERIRLSVGEEIHLPRNTPYIIRNIGGTTARWLYGQRQTTSPSIQPIKSIRESIPIPQ